MFKMPRAPKSWLQVTLDMRKAFLFVTTCIFKVAPTDLDPERYFFPLKMGLLTIPQLRNPTSSTFVTSLYTL